MSAWTHADPIARTVDERAESRAITTALDAHAVACADFDTDKCAERLADSGPDRGARPGADSAPVRCANTQTVSERRFRGQW